MAAGPGNPLTVGALRADRGGPAGEDSGSRAPSRRNWDGALFWTAASILIAVHFALAFHAVRLKSPTADEYSYIATGYLYAKTGDFRLDRTHPPLLRLLIGLPLQTMDVWLPPLRKELWDGPDGYTLGYALGWEMLLRGHNDWRALLTRARLPILLLSCGLGLLIAVWGRRLYGSAGGLTALFLYAFSPNMLAHAGLATMDAGSAFFIAAFLFVLYLWLENPTTPRLAAAGALLGLALTAKVTAVLAIPAAAFALVRAHFDPDTRNIAAVPFARDAAAFAASAGAALLLVYGWPINPVYYGDTLRNVLLKSAASGAGGEDIPGMPHRNHAFYLFGNYSTQGWWWYYPAAMAVKTPLAVFGVLILILAAGTRRWLGRADFLIVGTAALILAAAAFNRVNIGLRHILPLYPLLFLYLGRAVHARRPSMRYWILFPLLVWHFSASLWIHPDHLAYFNEAAGGPASAHKWLDDSNIDWGQDLGRLDETHDRFPDRPLYLATNWMNNPEIYGYEAIPLDEAQIADPPEGIVAVGLHWAIRHRITPRSPAYFDWFEKYRPVGRVGRSIWLYEFGGGAGGTDSMGGAYEKRGPFRPLR